MGKKDNQEFLRKLDHFDEAGRKISYGIVVALYVVFTCFILAAAVYYGVRQFQGKGDPEQFAVCCVMVLVLAAIPVCNKLLDRFFKQLGQKNDAFDPRTMALPEQGTVTLEAALHRMSTQTGTIVWDVIWGCVEFSLLFLWIFNLGNRTRILLDCAFVVVLIIVGHTGFQLMWKKQSFIKKMLRNTSKAIVLDHPGVYAQAVEESLNRGVLSYEKELILTDEYILGSVEWDTSYMPVAIPRGQITELVFFYRRLTGGRTPRTVGILRCNADGKKMVDFVLGPPLKAEKIKKILGYLQISWREEELTYI